MQKILINVISITFAMKSEKILKKHNIKCNIIKTPAKFSGHGCSYSILINKSDLEASKSILSDNNITISGFYLLEE